MAVFHLLQQLVTCCVLVQFSFCAENYRNATYVGSAFVKKKFEENGIVPDLIDKSPTEPLTVKYATNITVDYGKELTPRQVKKKPSDVKWNAEKGAFYTIIMIDPDAMSRQNPTMRSIKHWLVVNVPGSGMNIKAGTVIQPYAGSKPPLNSGLHRYILLVYKQPGLVDTADQRVNNNTHIMFDIREFSKANKLGDPVAGNFFQSQFDDYVASLSFSVPAQPPSIWALIFSLQAITFFC